MPSISIDELIEKSGNQKWVGIYSTINNWMLVATGVANCIFAGTISMTAVLFFDWASCNMGWSGVCGNRWWTHAIAFAFVIPLCLPSRIGIFAATSMFASVIIIVAINFIMGYQYSQVVSNGINASVHWFKPWRIGQFYGVASFSIEGIGLILPIRATMKKYHSFRWLFHVVGSVIVAWYFMFGASGAMVV
jgi:Transmembrane amino acid transporter protein